MRFLFTQIRRYPPPPSVITAGLIARFDADALPGSDGSAVLSWPDTSGFTTAPGYAAALAAGNAPLLVKNQANGRATVRFSGYTDFYHTIPAGSSFWENHSLFVVCRPTVSQSGYRGLFSATELSLGPSVFASLGGGPGHWGTYGAAFFNVSAGEVLPVNQLSVLSMVGNKTLATGTMYRDQNAGIGYANGSDAQPSGHIGGLGATYNQGFLGEIFEVLVYNRRLSEEERGQTIAFLRWKYGF